MSCLLVALAVLQPAASPNEFSRAPRSSRVPLGGCRSHHDQDQTRIRHEGQGKGREDGRAEAVRIGRKEGYCGLNLASNYYGACIEQAPFLC